MEDVRSKEYDVQMEERKRKLSPRITRLHISLYKSHRKNHCNPRHGLFQNAIEYCYAIHCPDTRQVTGEGERERERIRWKKGVLLSLTKHHRKLYPSLLGVKVSAATYPKILIFSETSLCLYILIP